MSRFAVVVILPQPVDDARRVDFASHEFDTWDEALGLMAELEEQEPKWRVVSFCHVEDLPLLMEPPAGAS